MSTLWISLKHNANCCSSFVDVVHQPATNNSRDSANRKLGYEFADEEENPLIHSRFNHYSARNRFQELGIGNPSRNIIEMIFRASFTNPRKRSSRKVRRVLKVNNSLESVHKFEEYREHVRKTSSSSSSNSNSNSSEQQHVTRHHPRSTVDGNELRQFYGTTVNCCGRKTTPSRMCEVCVDPTCSMCRVIQAGFNTPYNKIYGIRLSANSDAMSEERGAGVAARRKKVKRAAIICRTIAGLGFPSNKNNHHSLVLCDPMAVLPCFIVVYD